MNKAWAHTLNHGHYLFRVRLPCKSLQDLSFRPEAIFLFEWPLAYYVSKGWRSCTHLGFLRKDGDWTLGSMSRAKKDTWKFYVLGGDGFVLNLQNVWVQCHLFSVFPEQLIYSTLLMNFAAVLLVRAYSVGVNNERKPDVSESSLSDSVMLMTQYIRTNVSSFQYVNSSDPICINYSQWNRSSPLQQLTEICKGFLIYFFCLLQHKSLSWKRIWKARIIDRTEDVKYYKVKIFKNIKF